MANSSSRSNGDMPFSIDIDDYEDADVVAFDNTMHKLGKFKDVVKEMVKDSLRSFLYTELKSKLGVSNAEWLNPGQNCEILKTSGKGWKKGKLKFEITVKFYPDEPEIEEVNQAEPTLDDIRLSLDKLRQ